MACRCRCSAFVPLDLIRTWGFDAQLLAKAEALVAPGSASGPVELVASVNCTVFRVLAENISRERAFGDASIRISGRGRNAVLAAPYAPVMTFSNAEKNLRGN